MFDKPKQKSRTDIFMTSIKQKSQSISVALPLLTFGVLLIVQRENIHTLCCSPTPPPLPSWPPNDANEISGMVGKWNAIDPGSLGRKLEIRSDRTIIDVPIGGTRVEPFLPQKGKYLFRYGDHQCWAEVTFKSGCKMTLGYFHEYNPSCIHGDLLKEAPGCGGTQLSGVIEEGWLTMFWRKLAGLWS